MKVLSILGLIFMVIGIGFVAILKSKVAWIIVIYGFVLWILNIESTSIGKHNDSDEITDNFVDYGDSSDYSGND